MAIQLQGLSGIVAEVDGAAFRAIRTSPRPTDHGVLGHFAVAAETGAIAAGMAANGILFSARWTDPSRFAVVQLVRVTGMRATTAFAAGTITIELRLARSFTASDSGGTSIILTGNNQKMRTSMGSSLFGDMRIASTAALTAGTKTLDSQAIGQITTHSSAGYAGATPIVGSIYLPTLDLFKSDMGSGECPIILSQNEGFNIRATVPGTGVWNIGFLIKWLEVTSF